MWEMPCKGVEIFCGFKKLDWKRDAATLHLHKRWFCSLNCLSLLVNAIYYSMLKNLNSIPAFNKIMKDGR